MRIYLVSYGDGHLYDTSTKYAPKEIWKVFNTLYFYCPETDKYIESLEVIEIENPKEIKPGIVIGGDHSITYYSLKNFDKNITYLVFDAHFDCLNEDFHHGSFNYYLIKEGYNPLFFGVRSYDKNEYDLCKDKFFNPFEIKDKEVYISIDIDVLDCYVPTWEPGGISFMELDKYLKFLIENNKVLGIDIVESTPKYYPSILIGAQLLKRILCYLQPKTLK